MSTAVPLSRQFVSISRAYQTEDLALGEAWQSLAGGERKGWRDLLAQFRVVILAEAGAGKTYELMAAARKLSEEGCPAFFIRIEDIHANFENAFETGDEAAFRDWLAGSEEAWFFLDSVDEVRLGNPRAFEDAIRAFGAKIRDARQRAHVVISSRPYAWRSALDRALIEEVLPFASSDTKAETGDDSEEGATVTVSQVKSEDGTPVELYFLAPLNDADISLFSEHRGVPDTGPFLEAVKRGALMPLAQRPFDLQELVESWTARGVFGSRLEVLQTSIGHHLGALKGTSLVKARTAAEELAVAAVLTGKSSFRLPGGGGATAIQVDDLLTGWSDPEITGLLGTGLFSEPVYGEVRFRHREIRELLAASWFAARMDDPNARDHLDSLIYRSQFGQTSLARRLRPILPWLILLDDGVCEVVLSEYPEVAVEGGDPASLKLDVRRTMLSALIYRLIEPASMVNGLDNSEVARIAQTDIASEVLKLIVEHRTNDDALFVLARLVWQGQLAICVPLMVEIASDVHRGIYTRLVAIRAVGSVAQSTTLLALWRDLIARGDLLPRRLLAELLDHAPGTAEAVDLILASIDRLEPHKEFEVTGLRQGFTGFIERLPAPTTSAADPVTGLIMGLAGFLTRAPHVEPKDCEISEEHAWLVGPALHVAERLVDARHPTALNPAVLAVLAGAASLRFWKNERYGERSSTLGKTVPQWVELNDALFWWTVGHRRRASSEPLVDDWPVTWMDHFWAFEQDSLSRTLSWVASRSGDDQMVALSRSVRTYVEGGKQASNLTALQAEVAGSPALETALEQRLNPPPSSSSEKYERYERDRLRKKRERDDEDARLRAEFHARLVADPAAVRRPPGLEAGKLGVDQYNLMRVLEGDGMSSTWSDGANWRRLIPDFGIDVATAYRDGAMDAWRAYNPGLRSDDWDGNSTPYVLIFAMAGLSFELQDPAALQALTPKLAQRAFRYALRELNGFPKWFEPLYRSKPNAAREFLWNELRWELENTQPDQSLHYVLSRIVYYAPWLHKELASAVLTWLQGHEPATLEALDHCRAIVMGGASEPSVIANLAKTKLANATTPEAHRPTWQALWIDADQASGLPDLRGRLDRGEISDPEAFCTALCVALLGRFRTASPLFWTFRTPTALKDFYLLTHQQIRVADDLHRANTGVYSPTARDDAQDARERLLGLLSELPGQLAYEAIRELADAHPDPQYKNYLGTKARRRAEAEADLPSWTVLQVAKLANRVATSGAPRASSHAVD
ncbi:NACHT domain-containing protein [Brevundimonas sp. DWR2-3-1b1]|uniref:NACHT domain-containing protein n=1 Tax=unclassified Brevundimonas TaxID=2622653 RepID=UPI003CF1C2AB